MSRTDVIGQPGISPAGNSPRESWGEWFDRHSRTFFIAPAVTLILVFAIFPTFYSIVFALSRVRFTAARSASSSVAVGVPQTAMTASPMNFSTVPP